MSNIQQFGEIDNFTTDLTGVHTKLLVEELLKREGVEFSYIAPYDPVTAYFINNGDKQTTTNYSKVGPCILIKVID